MAFEHATFVSKLVRDIGSTSCLAPLAVFTAAFIRCVHANIVVLSGNKYFNA